MRNMATGHNMKPDYRECPLETDLTAVVARRGRRHSVRRTLGLLSLLLFPITLNYFSPYIIVDSASRGVINGSLIVFTLMFVASLFVGRFWYGWHSPPLLRASCTVRLLPRRGSGAGADRPAHPRTD